jgi:hypothetical protein
MREDNIACMLCHMPDRLLQTRTAARCTICRSPNRAAIEELIWARSKRELNREGGPTNLEYVQARAKALGIPKLHSTTITRHLKAHIAIINDAQAQAIVKKDVRTTVEAEIAANPEVRRTPEEFLDLVVSAAYQRLLADPASATTDQAIAAINARTRRKSEEGTAQLMQLLAKSTGAALAALSTTKPAEDVIEAEVVQEIPAA